MTLAFLLMKLRLVIHQHSPNFLMSTFIAKVMPKSQKGKGRAEPPPTTITLFCWILGVSDSPFSIDIEDSKTVDHLKKAIVKEKPVTFANVEADQLKLWKVSGFSPLRLIMLTTLLQDIHRDHWGSQEPSDQTRS
jgi:hypothetical protein